MRRKRLRAMASGVLVFCSLAALGLRTRPARAQNIDPASAMRHFQDDWYAFYLETNPETATQLGEYKYNDMLSHYSPEYFAGVKQRAAGLLTRLQAIDISRGGEMEKLDHRILVSLLQDKIHEIELKLYELPVDQFNGVQIFFPQIATYAPFDTVKQYDDYIARLEQIPERFDEVVDALNQGIKDGLLPPKFLLEKAADQCKTVAEPAGRQSSFAAPLQKMPASLGAADKARIQQAMLGAIDNQVRPAYRKLEHYLTANYVPKGRLDPGIWSLPQGADRYRFAIQEETTSDLSPEQIHQLGLTQVSELEAEVNALAKKAGYPNGKAFVKAAAANPKTRAVNREQILDNFRRYIGQMQPKLPELFGLLPKAMVTVTSVPAFMEKEGSTEYVPGTPDGSRPGQVWVDTYDPTNHDMTDDEATAYHEGIPGHHMQISIAQELPNLHPFHRALQFNAYVEGWALYAERLGKEVGFYQDPLSDLGRLQSELFRAVRLVEDTGVHYKRWTRQQMVDYFNEHYGSCPQAEVDRYIAWPGQALGYKLGQLKILELRKRAQEALGPRFEIKAFHDEILNAGALPLNVLDTRVTNWIEERQHKTGQATN